MSVRAALFFITLVYALGSCKSTKVAATKNVPKPELKKTVELDVTPEAQVYLDTIEIGVHRLLKDTISIIAVGDIMMGTNYPTADYLPEENGSNLLSKVNYILSDSDLTFGNLEGVILNEGGEPKKCNNPKLCYLFRSPEVFINNLLVAGFDILSIANNHAGDFGEAGKLNTIRVLDSVGIKHAGSITQPSVIFTKDGVRYGFAAFAPNAGTASIHDYETAGRIINRLDSLSDIVIVSFHAGAEGKDHQHVSRQSEFFHGEDRGNVYKFAHFSIDWGADIILGHGPHVTRAVEVYKNRFIAYSMGNFCTYARFNLRGVNGIAPIFKVLCKPDGTFQKAVVVSIKQTGLGIPKIDNQHQAYNLIKKLSEEDFPNNSLEFHNSGIITNIQNQ